MFLRNPLRIDRIRCLCDSICDGHPEEMTARSSRLEPIPVPSRRQVLRATIAGTAAGVLTSAGIELSVPRQAQAQSTLSPDAALQMLMEGNQRFVERRLTFYKDDLAILQQNTAEKQEPFVFVF